MPQDHPPSPAEGSRTRIALMIDGDNISHELAGRILTNAGKHGEATIRRVYGNATRRPGWQAAPGLSFRHAGAHKNAADLLLTVEAMDIMLTGAADILIVVSSDGDFTHLATHLRERGFPVIGFGEAKAPEGFRRSCSRFVEITPAAPELTPAEQVIAILRAAPGQSLPIMTLSARMRSTYQVSIGDLGQKTWRNWLSSRPDLFDLGPKGPSATVTLKKASA